MMFLGNSPISLAATKHRGIQALSSAESEIIQVTETFKKVIWLQPLIIDLGFPQLTLASIMLADNEPAHTSYCIIPHILAGRST